MHMQLYMFSSAVLRQLFPCHVVTANLSRNVELHSAKVTTEAVAVNSGTVSRVFQGQKTRDMKPMT